MTRIDYLNHVPEFMTKLHSISQDLERFSIDPKIRALVETRVSQVNGCAYCVHLHLKEARKIGELQQKLDSLANWRESTCFDERERVALGWAESLTNIRETHAADAEYSSLIIFFSDLEIVEMSICISLTNFWNRMASGFRQKHKEPDY